MTTSKPTVRGKQVLALEAEALKNLSDNLPKSFDAICEAIINCKGRIIVSGLGKAGLIGQKISATLSSTGTPSIFLHPSEALHGDLGRLRASDVVLLLSNSGATPEVVRLIPLIKSIGAKSIAISASSNSELAQGCELALPLGSYDEACPLGLAPTVSTTAMLGLGDALAMAILELRNFSREEFARFHPAGALGQSLMRVKEIMRKNKELPLVSSGSSLGKALEIMTETPGRPGAALVINKKGSLLGIFTDGDLRRLIKQKEVPLGGIIDDYMNKKPTCLKDSMLVGEAIRMFKDLKIDQMPVIDKEGDAVGLVDIQDLLEVKI